MTFHQLQIFTLLPVTGAELPAAFEPTIRSDRFSVMCVQVRELLAYSTSVLAFGSTKLLFLLVRGGMRISNCEVRI